MSQKGYLIAEAKVGDAAAYEIYKAMAQAAIAEYGGRSMAAVRLVSATSLCSGVSASSSAAKPF
jgi:uncharacterized protein (DUF1330 family)